MARSFFFPKSFIRKNHYIGDNEYVAIFLHWLPPQGAKNIGCLKRSFAPV